MTPRLKYQIGTGFLATAFAILLVEILEMSGAMRSIVPGRELNIVAIVLLFGAIGFRRSGRQGMASQR